ncbi:MAG: 50S ribosomal protein L6 [Tissierellia bacterium]|nr:50S ribosomal protein L6 [Tissierellia bacterium]
MSRIGLKPIDLPKGVEIKVGEENMVEVKGPKGTLSQQLPKEMEISIEDGVLNVARPSETKRNRAFHGLTRTLIHNMVVGVTDGFEKVLEIEGTGYRAQKNGKVLNLTLGFSHPLDLTDPEGIEVEVPAQNKIIVRGIDKQLVGNYAAKIRGYRPPEPYKGKGIRYQGEYIRRKVGKTGK